MLEYKIVEKPAFTLMGVARMFDSLTCYQEIPKFWEEHMRTPGRKVCGDFGVCLDNDGRHFEYLIADVYVPWTDVQPGCVVRTIPAGTWAVFPCRGSLPDALQSVNSRIWREWLPSCRDYKLAGNYNIECYVSEKETTDEYSEIWVPLGAADAAK